jgi:hypothetical protein
VTQTLAQVGRGFLARGNSSRVVAVRLVKFFESQTDNGRLNSKKAAVRRLTKTFEGFDPGSERTLAAWIRHASRGNPSNGGTGVRGSKAWVPTLKFGIAIRDGG